MLVHANLFRSFIVVFVFLFASLLAGCSNEEATQNLPVEKQKAKSVQNVTEVVPSVAPVVKRTQATAIVPSVAPVVSSAATKSSPTQEKNSQLITDKQQISQIKRRDCRTRSEETPHNSYVMH